MPFAALALVALLLISVLWIIAAVPFTAVGDYERAERILDNLPASVYLDWVGSR